MYAYIYNKFSDFDILILASEKGLTYVDIYRNEDLTTYELNHPIMNKYIKVIDDFFKGMMPDPSIFDIKGTVFQRKVWDEVSKIPFGKTIYYQELANKIGSPNGSRAVGNALGKNPLTILIPCHRAIHKNGDKRGYSSDERLKFELLAFEKKLSDK
ncbi:methylated-DNA--[protein]-cysteine S-methyltransferase [Acholeplasma hippikon]|uniref:methylated-DNA--[protein]-cysteine S-methyltransferase n=1 Tax=Acholeplasma hippikon TaxID=264636 RepID=A0A449BLE2_9MOLU|nr:methylated-DNA--[protein]-cysteine S-methyltransferase [Acholeplasma hippikon]VEU83257.1 Methylated-DNA--protein-cysteine methyltransferase [Acholeplasma hippikon]